MDAFQVWSRREYQERVEMAPESTRHSVPYPTAQEFDAILDPDLEALIDYSSDYEG